MKRKVSGGERAICLGRRVGGVKAEEWGWWKVEKTYPGRFLELFCWDAGEEERRADGGREIPRPPSVPERAKK